MTLTQPQNTDSPVYQQTTIAPSDATASNTPDFTTGPRQHSYNANASGTVGIPHNAINRAPHLYRSYDHYAPYESLSPEHRQLRDLIRVSGTVQTLLDQFDALRIRAMDTVEQEAWPHNGLAPERTSRAPEVQQYALQAPASVPFVSWDQTTSENLLIEGLDFPELTPLPIDEWLALAEDPSFDFSQFVQTPMIDGSVGPKYGDHDGAIQSHHSGVPSQGRYTRGQAQDFGLRRGPAGCDQPQPELGQPPPPTR